MSPPTCKSQLRTHCRQGTGTQVENLCVAYYGALRCQLLDEVHRICNETGRKFPTHLVLQSDNTPAQAKNQEVLMFLAYLVARGKWSPWLTLSCVPGRGR